MKDIESRIKVLREQHRVLEDNLIVAEKSFEGNMRINFIKKRKLSIKDEVERLEKEMSSE